MTVVSTKCRRFALNKYIIIFIVKCHIDSKRASLWIFNCQTKLYKISHKSTPYAFLWIWWQKMWAN